MKAKRTHCIGKTKGGNTKAVAWDLQLYWKRDSGTGAKFRKISKNNFSYTKPPMAAFEARFFGACRPISVQTREQES